jgi:Tol biopolymer transport system component
MYTGRAATGSLPDRIRPAVAAMLILALSGIAIDAAGDTAPGAAAAGGGINSGLVVTQVPIIQQGQPDDPLMAGLLRADLCEEARIVIVDPDGTKRVLSESFHSACDPDISFDGRRILFAGRRLVSDDWNIFEMNVDGTEVRQITRGLGDCRSPFYQGSIYTIVSDAPWPQIGFVGNGAGELNEHGHLPSTSLYTCRLDGSDVRRVTFNPSADVDPTMLPDGRMLFASWQRSTLQRGAIGRVSLFSAQTDGIDYALFAGDEGRRIKLMPAVTTDREVVFVEGDLIAPDGSGSLGAVSLRRNLHSYRPLSTARDGWFHSPSALPDGNILVSRRPAGGEGDHGVYRLDPRTGRSERLFDEPGWHDIQAKRAAPRPRPDGRSSVVTQSIPTGRLYCLNVHESDLPGHQRLLSEKQLRLRVLEGVPRRRDDAGDARGIPSLLQHRFFGIAPIEEDGSFNLKLPANRPVQLQLIDEAGMALRSCGWIWVRNRETRGCIGCHEDGERTPENRFVQALHRPSVELTLPPERRRTVDFRRDVVPILDNRCSTAACHGSGGSPPLLTGRTAAGDGRYTHSYVSLLAGFRLESAERSPAGLYIDPGRARTSPLIWRLLGRNTSRPWDATFDGTASRGLPHPDAAPLSADELQTMIEWIDLGALWDGIPVDNGRPAGSNEGAGGAR